jgi:hypothetical protein
MSGNGQNSNIKEPNRSDNEPNKNGSGQNRNIKEPSENGSEPND